MSRLKLKVIAILEENGTQNFAAKVPKFGNQTNFKFKNLKNILLLKIFN